MSDYFARLGEPRRPWLDPDALKNKFLTLSAEAHPDRVHGGTEAEKRLAQQRYAELNQAYQSLRNPKERLQHLLELETGAKPQQIQQVPAELMEFFFAVAQLFKQTDAFLAEKSKKSSPMLQVQLFETAQDWIEKLRGLQQQLGLRQQELAAELTRIDKRWVEQEKSDSRRDDLLRQLEELYRLFSYYGKWEAQLQERIVQLSL
jgi:DnaJ-domain-containing protein 1